VIVTSWTLMMLMVDADVAAAIIVIIAVVFSSKVATR
jgi:hypothetical protein